MKERLTLRNVIIWGAAFLALLFFFLSFAAKAELSYADGGYEVSYHFRNAFWDAKVVEAYVNGVYQDGGTLPESKIFALPLIGLILVLVAAIGAVVCSFLIKDKKVLRIALISAGVLSITGGIFAFFVGETAARTFIYMMTGSLDNYDEVRQMLIDYGYHFGPRALAIIIGIVSILAGGAYGASTFLPEKKLVK